MPTGFDVPSGSTLSEKLIPVAHRLADYLKRCRDSGSITPDKPKTSTDLIRAMAAAGFHIEGPAVRAMVNYLRIHKNPIGSTANGYFWANTPAELNSTIMHMMERIGAIQAAVTGLERSIPSGGQLELL